MTIAGSHTVHELAELLDNFDGFVAAMAAAYRSGWDIWSASDPAAADDWKRDYDSFLARWGRAAAAAQLAVDMGKSAILGWDLAVNEGAYQAMLLAYKPADGDPASFDDLDRRWRRAAAAPPPVYKAIQPTAPDADLGAYRAADAGVQAVQATLAAAKSAMPSTTTTVLLAAGAILAIGLVLKVAK